METTRGWNKMEVCVFLLLRNNEEYIRFVHLLDSKKFQCKSTKAKILHTGCKVLNCRRSRGEMAQPSRFPAVKLWPTDIHCLSDGSVFAHCQQSTVIPDLCYLLLLIFSAKPVLTSCRTIESLCHSAPLGTETTALGLIQCLAHGSQRNLFESRGANLASCGMQPCARTYPLVLGPPESRRRRTKRGQ